MKIKKELLPVNEFSRPGDKLQDISGIVLHWVGNAGTSAQQNRDYFASLEDGERGYGSAHYVIGLGGEIIQCIPDDEVAYHCGSKTYTDFGKRKFGTYPNNQTIGIELTHPEWDGEFTRKTMRAALKLCASLCSIYNLDPLRDITTHHDVVGWKACPKYFTEYPEELCVFKNEVWSRLT